MNKRLLKRIEKLERELQSLEQAVQDIWASCGCLRKEIEVKGFEISSCEPCEVCGLECICPTYCPEPEGPEEQDHD